MRKRVFLAIIAGSGAMAGEPVVTEKVVVDEIWSAVSVGFCLLTHGENQYVAYYDAERNMAVGQRKLSEKRFAKTVLPSRQGWDSHNYITTAVDAEGYIHLSGNMHVDPLLYFRSEKPNDIATLVRMPGMVGRNEKRCTYPKFMKGPDGRLVFHYRDGTSGNGTEIHNIYDTETRQWKRLFDTPLISGQGKMNAYQRGPALGPDGWYYLVWMWRDTPDAATNHDISCARSKDLLTWENMAGEPLALPIAINSPGTIIDPVPPGGGMINSGFAHAFDSRNRLVVSYHKHDENGNTQAYAARFVDGRWMVKAVSDWEGRHVFKGGGSGPSTFGTSLHLGGVTTHGAGKLAISFRHWKEGTGLLVFDEETFERLGEEPPRPQTARHPNALSKLQSDFPGMHVKWAGDRGTSPDPSSRYVLRWETLGPNRDRPRKGKLPPNAPLVLYRIRRADSPGE